MKITKKEAREAREMSGGAGGAGRLGRRAFLGAGAAGVAVVAANLMGGRLWAADPIAMKAEPEGQAPEVTIEKFSAEGKSEGNVKVPKVVKSEAEWQKQLSPASFRVTRKEGTEMPFSGQYASNHDHGIYHCVCCDTALFDSGTKFESGTGWPSFYQPISPRNIVQRTDSSLGMSREAISCKRCDAHLGHVFEDGPRPTGLRYCMNSVSFSFVKRT